MDYTISAKTHYAMSMSYDSLDYSMGCDHNTVASAMTCTISMSGSENDSDGIVSHVFKGDEITFGSATVVQGANLLGSYAASATYVASASASAAAKATPAAGSGSMAGAGLKTDASPSATGSGIQGLQNNVTRSATGSAAPAEHTGAASKLGMQGVAVLVLAGVVALSV